MPSSMKSPSAADANTSVVTGTTSDPETHTSMIFVRVINQRADGKWYPWKWGAGWGKGAKTKAAAFDRTVRAQVNGWRIKEPTWQLPVTGVKPGKLVVKAQARNHAQVYTQVKRATGRLR